MESRKIRLGRTVVLTLLFSIFITTLSGCSIWTIDVPSSHYEHTSVNANATTVFTVRNWMSEKEVDSRLAAELINRSSYAAEILKRKGIKSVEIEVATSKNTKGTCGGCAFSMYLIPEFSRRTIEVVWYDTTGKTPQIISTQSTEWKSDTWFIYFPIIIPSSLKAAFSEENKEYTFFEKMRGHPEINHAVIKLNDLIVDAIVDNKVDYPQSSKN
ncbi:hypothetical protein [Bdellovibrio sp. HCB-162]|uniref:hypothetical protein n=1 Tax=Bdellovibrio sp. HCB-162 TaxID=3394234 RepID=UPI0039BCC73E